MKLSIEQIKSIAIGTSYVDEADGRTILHRFTKEQEEAYKGWCDDFYNKCFATAGIRLEFFTDSTSMFLKVKVRHSSSRGFFTHDIFVDGKMIGQLGASHEEYSAMDNSQISGKFYLGEGEKKVCVYFPWSFSSQIAEISLDDGAKLEPVEKKYRMIMFGDSITHGYDAYSTVNSYATRLADMLNANAVNKGIGAEKFRPELAALKDYFEPDIITVAYGTNDWGCNDKAEFERSSKRFYENLSKNYPNAKIFAITPIWRADIDDSREFKFRYVNEYLHNIADKLDNVTAIDGYSFVPEDTSLFSDLYLHPNDDGFAYYAENLYKKIKDLI